MSSPQQRSLGVSPVQRKFTLSFSPLMWTTVVWLSVFLLRHLPLVAFPALRDDVVWFLILGYFGFTGAYMFARSTQLPVHRRLQSGVTSFFRVESVHKMILIFAVVGAVGSLARGIDIVFLRGLDYSEGISAARLENIALVGNEGVGTRPLSAIGKLLMGCSTVAIITALLRFEDLSQRLTIFAGLSWILLLILSVFEGGRNTIAVNLLLFGSAGIVRRRNGKRFFPFGVVTRSLARFFLVVVLGYILFVFIDRFSALGYTDDTVVSGIERAYSVEVSPWVKEMPAGPVKSLLLGLVMMIVYICHGLDQLGALFDWLQVGTPGYGRYNLDLMVIALERVGLPVTRFAFADLPKPGLYFTGLGEMFLDLGYAGTLMFLGGAGFWTGTTWRMLRGRNRLMPELLLSFSLCWILASPLYSIFPGFLGVLLAMLIFFVATPWVRRLRC